MIPADMRRKIRLVASMAVAGRRLAGQDDATIRGEATRVAAKAVERHLGDAWEQETYMAEIGRGIEAALRGGALESPAAALHGSRAPGRSDARDSTSG